MEYVRLRAPERHGEALIHPAASATELIAANQNQSASHDAALVSIREAARKELVALAYEYSRQYADLALPASGDSVVMSGHQPSLFHPGVWLKNFSLSQIGQAAGGVSINLMVDNDLCQSVGLAVPTVDGQDVSLSQIAFDQTGDTLVHECRKILDRETFDSFGKRVCAEHAPLVGDPLIARLWPKVLEAAPKVDNRLGASLAAGRHLLELEAGLTNLELPVSKMADSISFAKFFGLIARDATKFGQIYNSVVVEYRKQHRIRSRSHPVPELETVGGWQEVPFWCLDLDSPQRKRLFVRRAHAVHLALSNGDKVLAQFDAAELQQTSLADLVPGIAIRPRALATTMFSRLFGCDLFIHGIGGAKYDQLTEEIVRQFLGVELPAHMTCTATMKLPFSIAATTQADLVRLQQRLREMRFHPEKLLGTEAEQLKRAKRSLLTSKPDGSRKTWHHEMEKTNASMAQLLSAEHLGVERELARAKDALASGRVIGSREFGFALFSDSLVDELREIAARMA